MFIEVQLFAGARHHAGRDRVTLDVAEPATIAGIKRALAIAIPAIAPLLPSTRFAINREYAQDDDGVPSGAEVAAIPPVSGGEELR